ncbi:MAG: hypothetical protein JW986_10450 [Methanotrichaceae archaeon]|nr:hypothetical protein [Methanotrichaceae archaeon]
MSNHEIRWPALGLAATIVLLVASAGSTVFVCKEGCSFASIQEAIDSSIEGDTIEVLNGTYSENLYLNKRLTLKGEAGEMPMIYGGGRASAIVISADGAVLEGFNVTGSGHCGCGDSGIKIQANNCTVRGNIIRNNRYGIYATGKNNSIYGNDLIGNVANAYDTGENFWDLGPEGSSSSPWDMWYGGNYFGDFDQDEEGCRDEDGDRICDRPHNISGGANADHHPLAGPILA